jgi:hypothetical protein
VQEEGLGRERALGTEWVWARVAKNQLRKQKQRYKDEKRDVN